MQITKYQNHYYHWIRKAVGLYVFIFLTTSICIATEKEVINFKNAVTRLEIEVEGGRLAKANKSVVSIERLYQQIPHEMKGTLQVIPLKGKFDQLSALTALSYEQLNRQKKDAKYIKNLRKYVYEGQKYLQAGALKLASKAVNNMNRVFSLVSEQGQQEQEVTDLKVVIGQITNQVAQLNTAREEKNRVQLALQKEKYQFKKYYYYHKKYLRFLEYGKANRIEPYPKITMLQILQGMEPQAENYLAEFKNDFPIMYSRQTNSDVQRFDLTRDLLKNRTRYRDAYIQSVGNYLLEDQLLVNRQIEITLSGTGQIESKYLQEYYGPKADEVYQVVLDLQPYYQWIGATVPEDHVQRLHDFKIKISRLIESAADKNSADFSAYFPATPTTSDLAKALANRGGFTFRKAMIKREQIWQIKKDSKNTPLHRIGKGLMIFQATSEPFQRLYEVNLISIYSGGGNYEPISEAQLDGFVLPIKQRY